MCIINDIEDWREEQYKDFQATLTDGKEDYVNCAGCGDEVEPTEVLPFTMHDINEAKELDYCITCIKIYKSDNE